MKITIAHTDEERREAGLIEAFIRGLHPGATVRKSDKYAPFYHVYITTTKSEKRCSSRENA